MTTNKVNYDLVAPSYNNQRYQVRRLEGIAKALLSLTRRLKADHILEVGCGTGRWLAELQEHNYSIAGLDLSFGMLQQAQKVTITVRARQLCRER